MTKILADLKRKNHGRRKIEKNLGYADKSLDQILYKGANESIVNKLKEYQKLVNEGTIPSFTLNEEAVKYIKATKSQNPERALIDMLILEMAKMKSKVYGVSVEDAIDELEQNARIALRQIDFSAQKCTLHLRPFSNVVKNKKERNVIIHEDLLRYYVEMKLDNNSPDDFIFSKSFEPGPKKTNPQVPTKWWKKLVREQLGIDKYLYAAKHSGATAFIQAGASEDNLVDHLGHSSRFITRMYTREGIEQSKKVISKTKVEF